ncbi:MAG: M23 family metallopeptidase, partial [Bacteroidia bacterium]|nr:M23 family metallopeptidase [Bacteroidia bacterium]
AVVTKLKSQEKSLQKQIAEKKKRDRDLNNAILAIVRREIKDAEARAAAEAKKNNTVTNSEANRTTNPSTTIPVLRTATNNKPISYLNLNEKDIALNSSFEQNRGRLPWPVDNGVVTYHFSTNNVEGTMLKFDSPGITITTPSPGTPVKVVFDGEVAVVNNNGDGSYAVIVRHGKYFTTYSNLVSVTVSRGSSIKTGDVIGKVGRDDESNGGQIDFILMIETKNVNPEIWLRH